MHVSEEAAQTTRSSARNPDSGVREPAAAGDRDSAVPGLDLVEKVFTGKVLSVEYPANEEEIEAVAEQVDGEPPDED